MFRVDNLKCTGSSGIWKSGGYKQRYPNSWRPEVFKVLRNSGHLICVTELMSHVIAESTKIYKDTIHADSFMIFHDGLSQWWEPSGIFVRRSRF